MKRSGQTLLIVIFVMFILSSYALLMASLTVQATKVNRTFNHRTQALWISEAGLEKAVWCLNQASGTDCGGTYGDNYIGETVSFGGGTFVTSVTTAGIQKQVTSTGVYQGVDKIIQATFEKTGQTTNISFGHAVFGGVDGVKAQGNTTVVGGIFSNGDVTCSSATANINNDVTVAGANEIKGCRVDGVAKANTIDSSDIDQDAYYQTIINSTVAGTEYPNSPDPSPQSFPITQAMIDGWKDEAEQGGVYSGDLEIDDDMSLGPLKITGDLDIDSGVTLTLTGTIYVQGDVDLESNVAVVLDEAFGSQSGMIITDKDIDINSGTDFYGSSNGGVLLLLTESSNTSSIDVDPGGGKGSDVVLYAPNGTVTIDAQALQVSAKEVVLKPGSKINYHAKLLNLRLLGDSGGDLQWAFVPGSRTEQ